VEEDDEGSREKANKNKTRVLVHLTDGLHRERQQIPFLHVLARQTTGSFLSSGSIAHRSPFARLKRVGPSVMHPTPAECMRV
jgi:hypothetical protein